jgi:hypothetical protein
MIKYSNLCCHAYFTNLIAFQMDPYSIISTGCHNTDNKLYMQGLFSACYCTRTLLNIHILTHMFVSSDMTWSRILNCALMSEPNFVTLT